MVNIKYILFLSAISVLMSCKSETADDVKFSSEMLKLPETNIELSKEATTHTLSVESDCDWTVTKTVDNWNDLVVQQASSSSINISTDANPLRSDRTAILTITTKGGLKRNVNIRQAPGDAYLRIDDNQQQISFDEIAGSRSVHVQSNTTWKAIVSDAEWMRVEPAEGTEDQTISISVFKAITDTERQGTVTITSTETGVTTLASVRVTQKGLSEIKLRVKEEAMSFDCLGGSKPVVILESNAQWLVQVPSNVKWLHADAEKGSDAGQFTVTCDENVTTNVRNAAVTITSGSKMMQISVEQAAATLPEVNGFSPQSVENIIENASFSFGFESVFSVTEYGLCYSTASKVPDINSEHIGYTTDIKSMAAEMVTTGKLQPRSTYFVRAYAKSIAGIGYSTNVIEIQTLGSEPDIDDNPPLF